MRIGILTGGGDVPGLNPCIKALVSRMIDEGHSPTGIRRGWRGLLQLNPADPTSQYENTFPLNKNIVRSIDRAGGTILHTSRLNPSSLTLAELPDFLRPSSSDNPEELFDHTQHILDAIAALRLDALIVLGGDDTLSFAARIHQAGFPIISIPKTMDNDVAGTDYCLGFSTAITRSVAAIQELRSTVASHERIGVIEVFGRVSGELALISAYLSGANRAIIPEVPFDINRLADLLLKDRRTSPSLYAMMTISHGAQQMDASGGLAPRHNEAIRSGGFIAGLHPEIGLSTARQLETLTGIGSVFVELSFLVRGGAADTLDTMAAINFANAAMDLVGQKMFGRLVAVHEGRYTHVDAARPAEGPRRLDVAELYDPESYSPRVFTTLGKPMFLY